MRVLTDPPGAFLAVQPLADVTGAGDQAWSDRLHLYWLDPTASRHYRSRSKIARNVLRVLL